MQQRNLPYLPLKIRIEIMFILIGKKFFNDKNLLNTCNKNYNLKSTIMKGKTNDFTL